MAQSVKRPIDLLGWMLTGAVCLAAGWYARELTFSFTAAPSFDRPELFSDELDDLYARSLSVSGTWVTLGSTRTSDYARILCELATSTCFASLLKQLGQTWQIDQLVLPIKSADAMTLEAERSAKCFSHSLIVDRQTGVVTYSRIARFFPEREKQCTAAELRPVSLRIYGRKVS